MILFLGDSLTRGDLSYQFVDLVETKEEKVNRGQNGDTVLHGFKRLSQYERKHIDYLVVELGFNDLYFRSQGLGTIFELLKEEDFEEVFLDRLKDYKGRLMLFTLPFTPLVDTSIPSESIRRVARKLDAELIDLYEMEKELYEKGIPYTVDGVHLTKAMAERVASEISERLEKASMDHTL
ncbi:SGNH/GDSL hydrolase family protein [Guggenheimella bovis]